jgi:PIN domain nuclease of toxin-antitoxin system
LRLLLDTHVALWALTDNRKLSRKARALIQDPQNDIYFSAATIWEIAIKHALARKDMPVSATEAQKYFIAAGYIELPVHAHHAAAVESLPGHHADPFDRILVAQAQHEPMKLLTHDRQLIAYGQSIEFV